MRRTDDVAEVEAVLRAYEDGTRERDPETLRAVFHEGAVMSGWLGPDFLVGGPEPFYDALRAQEVGPDYTSRVTAVDVVGATARARTVEDGLFGLSFVNEFHLARGPEGWRIVSKLFHHDSPEG